ncbi:helix-turn-helix transcriptional regulator [Salinigranum marinum]|uniref:helix-turn-helix transcriptional regulator n=1 Tax=Salinigranum marinum TaxID=1515595 RepID=UPI002989DBDE|nr:hypothetical protein [Salinigranum marinum]
MSRGRRVVVVFIAVALLVGGGAASGDVRATDHGSGGFGATQLGDAGIEPDGVLLGVDLRADGSARWTVEYRVRLNDENTTAAFESLRTDIAANETAYTATFGERMRATARAAENTTGREMGVRNVTIDTARQQLPQEYGVVTYGFEWTGFAATSDDELRAGDALAGLFLDRQTTLLVAWPDGYRPTAVDPSPDERRDDAVVWVGPLDFDTGQPAIVLSAAETKTATAAGEGGDGDDAGPDDGDSAAGESAAGEPVSLLVAVGVVAIGVLAALAWRRSRSGGGAEPADGSDGDAGSVAPDSGRDASAEPHDSDAETRHGGDEPAAPWTDELLSNEERVLALLEHNDGRMKQQAIAAELEWSDAKTSQVIGKMRDADTVETFRIGRENVVSFPDDGLA